jgi:hypothetical protein
MRILRIYALCMAGRIEEAAAHARGLARASGRDERERAVLRFLDERFGLALDSAGPDPR